MRRDVYILYALPAFVMAFPTIPVFVLLPTFYAETVGLGLAAVGSALFALRLLDVISDPVLGYISDRIPAQYGKRKLPMAVGAILTAPALILLFSPPDDATIAYLYATGAALYLGWTAIQIPYLSWAAELVPDYTNRTRINGYREGAGLLGILSVGALGLILADLAEIQRFQTIAWITVVAGALTFYLCLRYVPQGRLSLQKQSLTFPWKNKLFLRVLSAWFINGLANGLPAVCLPLYLTHILKADDQTEGMLLFVYFLFAVLGIPLWLKLSKTISKHHIWCLSMLMACVVFLFVPFLGEGDVIAFGIVCLLTGLALGSDLALPPAIQADCADWDKLRFKTDRLASLFSYWSMATKMALGVAVGIAFPVLDFFGLDQNSEAGKIALIVIYAGLPVVLKTSAVALMWHFPLTQQKHSFVQKKLEQHQ
jgi:Na+/melibiose symporter-like transporter